MMILTVYQMIFVMLAKKKGPEIMKKPGETLLTNCINCGQPLPEDKLVFDIPTTDEMPEINNLARLEFNVSSEPLQLGLNCPTCRSNAAAIKDLMQRGALDGKPYILMQLERKIVKHLKVMEKNWLKQAAIELKADPDSGFAYDLFMMYCGSQIIQEKECKYSFAWLDFKDPEKRQKMLAKYNIEL